MPVLYNLRDVARPAKERWSGNEQDTERDSVAGTQAPLPPLPNLVPDWSHIFPILWLWPGVDDQGLGHLVMESLAPVVDEDPEISQIFFYTMNKQLL